MKVTLVPAHIVVAEAETLTLTAEFGLTVITSELEVAGLPVAHDSLEVSTQVTAFPLASVVEVNVGLFVPTLTPFTFH
ncbi:hypothetical protein SDC9_88407 [bioreactor metagenome]|uniref:Uncharacterized protein n=1 Tax=bioreactor metagenome TaxID=1076179 RepID=A0A644ZN05_9ZZZZ